MPNFEYTPKLKTSFLNARAVCGVPESVACTCQPNISPLAPKALVTYNNSRAVCFSFGDLDKEWFTVNANSERRNFAFFVV